MSMTSKTSTLFGIALLLFHFNTTSQNISEMALFQATPTAASAQKAFDAYLKSGRNTEKGIRELAQLQRHLPKEKKNIDSLRALLGTKISGEERKSALRLLGEMYDRNNRHEQNDRIFYELKSSIQSSDPEIAVTALYAYTRSGYDHDYLSILKAAKRRGLIDDDSYYGEHAHSISSAPESVQKALINEIALSKNQYALEILASGLPLEEFTPTVKSALLTLFEGNEPKFPMAIGDFGGTENYYYENWLNSLTRLQGIPSAGQRDDFVVSMLLRERTDPRKVLAYLSGPYGRDLIKRSTDVRKLDALNRKICSYANSFPTTPSIQEPANIVQATLSGTHRQFAGLSCAKYDE